MTHASLTKLVKTLGLLLKCQQLKLVTAESCTGGYFAQTITSIPGSSNWFDRGFVCYSNVAKQDMLHVSPKILEKFGSVSAPTARAMARGALKQCDASVSIAITGIAGPAGGTFKKPVGTVWIAIATKPTKIIAKKYHFTRTRETIRRKTVFHALKLLISVL